MDQSMIKINEIEVQSVIKVACRLGRNYIASWH